MTTRFKAGVLTVLLLLALCSGYAGAAGAGDRAGQRTGPSVSPDATGKMILWNVGPTGFLPSACPWTFSRHPGHSILSLPAGSMAQVIAPITVPSSINGKNCKVKTIYLNWSATASSSVTRLTLYGGVFPLRDMSVNYPGDGSYQTVSFDLGDSYSMPCGLSAVFEIQNMGSGDNIVINGYGAKITYPI